MSHIDSMQVGSQLAASSGPSNNHVSTNTIHNLIEGGQDMLQPNEESKDRATSFDLGVKSVTEHILRLMMGQSSVRQWLVMGSQK
jgi:CRISPR/Cas system CMR-associated protein Cmr5 small subunit